MEEIKEVCKSRSKGRRDKAIIAANKKSILLREQSISPRHLSNYKKKLKSRGKFTLESWLGLS
jgi:hypothetical protein